MMRKTLLSILIVLPLVAITALFVLATLVGSSAGGRLASGRTVTVYSDSIYLSTQFAANTATIQTAWKEIVVEPTSLVVGGVPVASIPSGIRRVDVRVQRGAITFVADGHVVPTVIR